VLSAAAERHGQRARGVRPPAAGAVHRPGRANLSVTFTPTDSANYATATTGVAINVAKATPAIT
jgi:hypothetical protein